MRYYAPKQGTYQLGLTARLMYSIVYSLIKKHVTNEDIRLLNEIPDLGLVKLWTKPEIRSELEEFVGSYFFTDLKKLLPDLKEVVMERNAQIYTDKLEDNMTQLERQYGNRNEANKQVIIVLSELEKRTYKIYDEISKLENLKDVKPLVKINAEDGFSHIAGIYGGRIEIIRDHLIIS